MAKPKTEAEARRWLASKLGHKGVPDALWVHLRDRGLVRDALKGEEEAFEWLLDEARQLRRLLRAKPDQEGLARPSGESQTALGLLRRDEAERTWAFSRQLGRVANQDRRVLRLREVLFGGKTLSAGDALKFYRSPAPYLLGAEEFRALGDGATVLPTRFGADVGPGGKSEWVETIALKFTIGRRASKRVFRVERNTVGESRLMLPEALSMEGSPLPVRAGTIAFDLMRASQELEVTYPWNERDALWFILTGQAPWATPIRVEPRKRGAKHRFEHMEL